jgi:hypothetical protein
VLERKDVAPADCDPIPESPGLIRADFNGDGLDDYAALLKIGGSEQRRLWEGKTWTLIEVWFVVFLGQREEGFRSIVLEKLEQYIPVMVVLDLQKPGLVREYAEIEYEKRKIIQLKRMSISRLRCGRSEAIFYWDDARNRFRMVTVSD